MNPSLRQLTLTGALSQGRRCTGPELDLLLLFVLRQVTWPQLHCVVLDGIELQILLPLWSGCWDCKPATGLCEAGNGTRVLHQGRHSTSKLRPHVVPCLRMGQGQRSVVPSLPPFPPLFWGAVNGIQGLNHTGGILQLLFSPTLTSPFICFEV